MTANTFNFDKAKILLSGEEVAEKHQLYTDIRGILINKKTPVVYRHQRYTDQ